MDHQRDFIVFLSYSRSDTAMKDWVEGTIRDLSDVNVWVDSQAIVPGDPIHANIEKGLKKSDCVLAILTENSIKSSEVWEELIRADEREIPILVLKELKVTRDSLPHFLRDIAFIEYDQKDYRHSLLDVKNRITEMVKRAVTKKLASALKDVIHRCETPVSEDLIPGLVSPEELKASQKRMTDEVFAIELLTQPVRLKRDRGTVTVTVDRRGVKEMLISNEAKRFAIEKYVTHQKKAHLLQRDREIQKFLAEGDSPAESLIDLPELDIPLRWASGGILSIVTDERGKQWVPLFFRDIRPYGWNIALGTSERWFDPMSGLVDENYTLPRDLNNPLTFMLREFLEESIVVTGTPEPNGTLFHKRFRFSDYESSDFEKRADEFYKNHRKLRLKEDELAIEETQDERIQVEFDNPRCDLRVVYGDSRELTTKGLLICFSLLDLGIEVVKVAKYKLNENDWMLDGEIREWHVATTGKTEMKLIRMPVVMMTLDYLREIFGQDQEWHRYTFGPQPSIKATRAPKPAEIGHFHWDVRRRMQAVEGEWGDEWQRDRFVGWYDKFGSHFIKDRESIDDKWQLSYANPSQLFVPGTAKILNLYFNLVERKEKN